MTPLLTRTLLSVLLVGCSGTQAQTAAPLASFASAGGVTTPAPLRTTIRQRIEAHMGFLASDAMGGRETGTIEGEITAAYLASVMRGLGLAPAGGGGLYTQDYPLHRSQLDLDSLELSFGGAEPWAPIDDYTLRGLGAEPLDLLGEVVFAGHGVVDSESGLDQLAGLPIEGRFVAVFTGVPPGFEGLDERVHSGTKRDAVEERGGLGLILLSGEDDKQAARTRSWLRRSATHARLVLGGATASPTSLVRVYPEPRLSEALLAAAGLDFQTELTERAEEPMTPGLVLDGVELTLRGEVAVDELWAQNVAGLLPGDDPELGEEVIVVSAHMDHVGVNSEGAVHNGADDNASGTATLLSVAETLASRAEPLRRSVLFLAVSGEEKGLLGSEWWVKNPTLPIDSVIADINVDMVGRNDPDSVGITPSPEHADYNTLVAQAVAAGPGVGLSVSWSAGEGKYRRRVDSYYSRSDHANFAEKGIPVVFFFAGEHEDYHQPGDTLDKIDFDKVAKVSQLVETLVASVAEADDRPQRLVD